MTLLRRHIIILNDGDRLKIGSQGALMSLAGRRCMLTFRASVFMYKHAAMPGDDESTVVPKELIPGNFGRYKISARTLGS